MASVGNLLRILLRKKVLDLICVAVVCVDLTLGLWPFHVPRNQVEWVGTGGGLRFGSFGTIISSNDVGEPNAIGEASASFEVWLQPRRIWDDGTILAFCTPAIPNSFSLRQHNGGLIVQARSRGLSSPAKIEVLYMRETLHRSVPTFLTVTTGTDGTSVYVDGALAAAAQSSIPAQDLAGRFVLGDACGQTDTWSGQLLGLAVYRSELTAPQVLRHYQTWMESKRPAIAAAELNSALYLFGEQAGDVVHDDSGSNANLYIPQKYNVLNKIFLEPFWSEFSMSRSFWGGVLKNVVGFVPLGFCFYICLSVQRLKPSALSTVLGGFLVSLTIEVLQGYLPTRDSGTTDLITNSFGTYIGVVASRVVIPMLTQWLPQPDLIRSFRG